MEEEAEEEVVVGKEMEEYICQGGSGGRKLRSGRGSRGNGRRRRKMWGWKSKWKINWK